MKTIILPEINHEYVEFLLYGWTIYSKIALFNHRLYLPYIRVSNIRLDYIFQNSFA